MGHDGLHSVFLKNASDEFLNVVVALLNACFTHCYLSHSLLIGVIFPTVKDMKGNITEATNYRPVMQSSCLLKLFEAHMLNILSEKIFFNHRQFGFSRGLSTTDNCFILKEVFHEYSKGKRKGFATFIDLSKAFDMVDHFLFGHKLLDKGIPSDIIYILMNYLRNQYAKVLWKEASSSVFEVENGVRQGGILSPFLFKFFINDIIEEIANMKEGCMLGITKVNILAYADDLVLIAGSKCDMDSLYTRLRQMISDHKLLINKRKSKCLIFSRSAVVNGPKSVNLGGDDLEIVNCYKHLGHFVENTLQDCSDIGYRLNKFYSSTNSVFRNFRNVNLESLIYLFNSYCLPVYGLCLWNYKDTFNRSVFKTFNVAYNNFLKRIVGAPKYASSHVTAEVCNQPLFKHHVALLQCKYYKRLLRSNNYIIKLNLTFLKQGYFIQHVSSMFQDIYNLDISRNDFDILAARIDWVQKHEDRRTPCLFYNI